jgi:hypothetical protein
LDFAAHRPPTLVVSGRLSIYSMITAYGWIAYEEWRICHLVARLFPDYCEVT